MPIAGVSDIRRLPRLGKIRLGIKTTNASGAEYPKAVDYFVVNEDDSTPAHAAAAFHQVYADKPRSVDVMFPVADRDIYFSQWYKAYGSGTGKICQGDGQIATKVDTQTGEMIEIGCDPDECPLYAKKHCRRQASLQFLLPKVPGLGVWQLDTTSFHSIVNLNSALDFITAVAGRAHMIPLQLIVRPQEVAPDGKKKVVYVLDLRMDQVRLSDVARLGQIPVDRVFLLDKPDDSKPPDDLYPRSLVESIPTGPASQEEEPPAREPEVLPPEGASDNGPDPLEVALQEYIEAAGWFPAKIKAKLAQYGGDKQKLLAKLKAEVDGKKPQAPPAPPPAASSTPPASKAGSAKPGRTPTSGSARAQVPPVAPQSPPPTATGQAQQAFF